MSWEIVFSGLFNAFVYFYISASHLKKRLLPSVHLHRVPQSCHLFNIIFSGLFYLVADRTGLLRSSQGIMTVIHHCYLTKAKLHSCLTVHSCNNGFTVKGTVWAFSFSYSIKCLLMQQGWTVEMQSMADICFFLTVIISVTHWEIPTL